MQGARDAVTPSLRVPTRLPQVSRSPRGHPVSGPPPTRPRPWFADPDFAFPDPGRSALPGVPSELPRTPSPLSRGDVGCPAAPGCRGRGRGRSDQATSGDPQEPRPGLSGVSGLVLSSFSCKRPSARQVSGAPLHADFVRARWTGWTLGPGTASPSKLRAAARPPSSTREAEAGGSQEEATCGP